MDSYVSERTKKLIFFYREVQRPFIVAIAAGALERLQAKLVESEARRRGPEIDFLGASGSIGGVRYTGLLHLAEE